MARTSNLQLSTALATALRRGPQTALQLAAGVAHAGQPTLRTVQRALAANPGIVTCGKASRTRYAVPQPVRGSLQSMPLYAVDEQGKAHALAALNLLAPQGSFCNISAAWPCEGLASDGWWDGLPYPVYDMQPQGFLGRSFARLMHQGLEIPPNPNDWRDEHTVVALSRSCPDVSGNLILGDASFEQFQTALRTPPEPVAVARLPAHYAALADQAVGQGNAGSSAAGEFPKFATSRTGPHAASATPHVIVKFSGVATSPATQRWADLLVCEHLAAQAIAQWPSALQGAAPQAATSRILQTQGRTFLESERFDRVGQHGRKPLVSLLNASAHWCGLALDDWRIHAQKLLQLKLLGLLDAQAIGHLWWFGQLIANSDMHFGNLSLYANDGTFTLAPAYDMLPMRYAPLAGGEVATPQWQAPLPKPPERSMWLSACSAALQFWQAAAVDSRISAQFQAVCHANGEQLLKLQDIA